MTYQTAAAATPSAELCGSLQREMRKTRDFASSLLTQLGENADAEVMFGEQLAAMQASFQDAARTAGCGARYEMVNDGMIATCSADHCPLRSGDDDER